MAKDIAQGNVADVPYKVTSNNLQHEIAEGDLTYYGIVKFTIGSVTKDMDVIISCISNPGIILSDSIEDGNMFNYTGKKPIVVAEHVFNETWLSICRDRRKIVGNKINF